MMWTVAEGRALIDGEEHLQDVRVSILCCGLRGEDDDGARGVEVDQLQVGQVERATSAADQTSITGRAQPVTQPILHLNLVLLGQDRHGRPPPAAVRFDELRDHCEHLIGPAEDDSVVALDHDGAALA